MTFGVRQQLQFSWRVWQATDPSPEVEKEAALAAFGPNPFQSLIQGYPSHARHRASWAHGEAEWPGDQSSPETDMRERPVNMLGWAVQTLIYIQVKAYKPESTCTVSKGSYDVSNGPWLVNTQWRFTGQERRNTNRCARASTQGTWSNLC